MPGPCGVAPLKLAQHFPAGAGGQSIEQDFVDVLGQEANGTIGKDKLHSPNVFAAEVAEGGAARVRLGVEPPHGRVVRGRGIRGGPMGEAPPLLPQAGT